jgi:pimeloyl-ACP methyl ester carboxylesterase
MQALSFINAKDGSVAVRSAGAGSPVILLHSSASSSAQWRDAMVELAPQHKVLAPDFPGYGKSPGWPGATPRTLGSDAEIVAFLARDCREPIHLVGHSYGGAVALWYAMRHPSMVKSLTLIEPVAFNVLRCGGRARRALLDEVEQLASVVVGALSRGDHRAGMAHFVNYWNGEGAWGRMPDERKVLLASQIENIAQEFGAVFEESLSAAAYGRLHVPTIIVRGDQSRAPAMSVAASLARAIPSATLQTVEGAGHMLPLTHKTQVHDAVMQHIARCDGRFQPAGDLRQAA